MVHMQALTSYQGRLNATLQKSFMFAELEPNDMSIIVNAMKEVLSFVDLGWSMLYIPLSQSDLRSVHPILTTIWGALLIFGLY